MEPHPKSGYRVSKYVVTEPFGRDVLVFSSRTAEQVRIPNPIWSAITVGDLSGLSIADRFVLEKWKVLVPADENEFETITKESQDAALNSNVLNLMIVPSSNCPLGCNLKEFGGYCGQTHSSNRMNEPIQDAVVKAIELELLPQHNTLSISWFGSEPLTGLSVIRRLTSFLQNVARDRGLAYYADITTGGTLLTLDVAIECFHELGINAFSLTLDGPSHIHDKRRCTKDGKPTYDIIINNINAIIAERNLKGAKIAVRCNVDGRNYHYMDELINEVAQMGWQEKVDLYFIPIHPWGSYDNQEIILSRDQYARAEVRWLNLLIERGFHPYPLPNKKPVVCRVVSNSHVVIGHDGGVHKCTETPLTPVNRKDDDLGRADKVPLFDKGYLWSWHDDIKSEIYPCRDCVFLPVCGGACPLAWKTKSSLPCPSFKEMFGDRMKIFAKLSERNQLPNRWTANRQRSEYSPLTLLRKVAESLINNNDHNIEHFANLLDSALLKARNGDLELSKYQLKQAELIRTCMKPNLQIHYLVGASIGAVEAFILYRAHNNQAAGDLILKVVENLHYASHGPYTIEVRPAQLQAVLNYLKIQVRGGSGPHDTLLEKVQGFLHGKRDLRVGKITISSFQLEKCKFDSEREQLLSSLQRIVLENHRMERDLSTFPQ